MLKKIITVICITSLCSACSNSPKDRLKSSANNKLFDTKGFHGSKRAPLYNKKYIAQAKKNVTDADYDHEEEEYEPDSEVENIAHENMEMYKSLADRDMEEVRARKDEASESNKLLYPTLSEERYKTSTISRNGEILELKEELEKLRVMLKETQKELANSKYSNSSEVEKTSINQKNQDSPSPENQNVKEAPEVKRSEVKSL